MLNVAGDFQLIFLAGAKSRKPNMTHQPEIAANLARVRAEIGAAAVEAGRNPTSVELCAVTKTFGADAIGAAIACGQKQFGENRVQEAETKWPALKAAHLGLELHLIGPLQTNKARKALELFDVIQTVDRPRIARCLADEMARAGSRLPCYVQVNTGDEPQKAGVGTAEVDAFIEVCRREYELPLVGLMCIPPHDDEPSLHFALLRDIAERHGLAGLSMGMSADFAVAVAFGATIVRVGSAIFGARAPLSPAAG